MLVNIRILQWFIYLWYSGLNLNVDWWFHIFIVSTNELNQSPGENFAVIFRHTSIAAQKARIIRLLDEKMDEVILHGLGAAVSRTINVALQIQRKLVDTVKLDVKTGTVKVSKRFMKYYA